VCRALITHSFFNAGSFARCAPAVGPCGGVCIWAPSVFLRRLW
jgi:hypothetical protein